jgi:hypothetical protein
VGLEMWIDLIAGKKNGVGTGEGKEGYYVSVTLSSIK